MNLGIIGANGFVGRALVNYLNNFDCYFVTSITKKNYYEKSAYKYDIIINANGNSKKYWANNNPLLDFEASVVSVYKSIFDFKYNQYIYISTIDVYKNNIYGFHKHIAEEIIFKHSQNHIILRCPLVIGKNMKKGILKDILNDKSLFVTKESRYQLITDTEIAKVIHSLINGSQPYVYNSVANIGSVDSLTVEDIFKFLGKNIKIKCQARTEEYFESPSRIYSFKTAKDYIKEIME